MPRGTALSEEEKVQILAWREAQWSITKISTRLNRSWDVVNTFLKDPIGYNSTPRPGRPPKMSPQATRRLFREASETGCSSRELKEKLDLPISPRHTRYLLQQNKNLRWEKSGKEPKLTPRHIEDRLVWSKFYSMYNQHQWARVVFSDEKRFCPDGPDGYKYYWRDLRKDKTISMSRRKGGGGLMMWGGISFYGTTSQAVMIGTQNSFDYTKILENNLLPFCDAHMPVGYIFQHDNASIHASKETSKWLKDSGLKVMDWPACSPDLNPIENVWGYMARKLYTNNKQYQTLTELKSEVLNVWKNIPADYIQGLIRSMHDRTVETIQKQGHFTHY